MILLDTLKILMNMKDFEIFYHGSPRLFAEFDLSHVLEGDGKVKFERMGRDRKRVSVYSVEQ